MTICETVFLSKETESVTFDFHVTFRLWENLLTTNLQEDGHGLVFPNITIQEKSVTLYGKSTLKKT